jgi:hypothetical protein
MVGGGHYHGKCRFSFGRHHTRMEQTMSQYLPFGFMILYAAILLLIAKPLDNWRESRIARDARAAKQGELFGAHKVDDERPLIASHR